MSFVIFFITLFYVVSCVDKSEKKADSLIDTKGIFYSKTEKYKLIVEINNNSIVNYSVIDIKLSKRLFSDNAGSIYQRWYMVWDDMDNLWVHSSDIGGCVWIQNTEGNWTKDRIFHIHLARKPIQIHLRKAEN